MRKKRNKEIRRKKGTKKHGITSEILYRRKENTYKVWFYNPGRFCCPKSTLVLHSVLNSWRKKKKILKYVHAVQLKSLISHNGQVVVSLCNDLKLEEQVILLEILMLLQ